MDRSTLHRLRLVVPGGMLAILGVTLQYPGSGLFSALREIDLGGLSGAGMLGLVGGALYTVLDLRSRLSGFSWEPIRTNVENRLLNLIKTTRLLTDRQTGYLRDGRRLLDLFYKILDNDESLKSRQEGVRFNGLLVTSVVDLSVVALFGWGLHFILALIRESRAHGFWSTGCFVTWVLSQSLLLRLSLDRHMELSNEQLDYIETNRRIELLNSVDRFLSTMPPAYL